MTQLDSIDRKILGALQNQGDLSSQDLADIVGTSAASAWRRVKALREAGVIGPAVRLLDPAKVGNGLDVFCQIRITSQSRDTRAAFEKFIDARDNVVGCYAVSGEWDYLLHIVAQDMSDYERVLMHDILDHHTIASSSSVFVLRRIKHTTALPI